MPNPLVAAMLALGLAVVALLAIPPGAASAGTYRVAQCHPGFGAAAGDAQFRASSPRYSGDASCGAAGLTIRHRRDSDQRPTQSGRFGAWRLDLPAGAELVRFAAKVAGSTDAGHRPELAFVLAGGGERKLASPSTRIRRVVHAGDGARAVIARLACRRSGGCGEGPDAGLTMRNVMLELRDEVSPKLTAAGPLLEPGSRRGDQDLEIAVSDEGSGVRRIQVEVNGAPLTAATLDCRLEKGVGLRMQPCPASRKRSFELSTEARQFRQGVNRIRVCASDMGSRGVSNRDCQAEQVRVDNLCPVSDAEGARMTARLVRGRRGSNRGDRIRGRVSDETGMPVSGARVCIASRVASPRAEERLVTTVRTDADGSYSARIPSGASRELRIAHWAGDDEVIERFISVDRRVRPRLALRPSRALRNGDRVRFAVTLPGPFEDGRRVEIEARSGRRWVAVTRGRTSATGRWTGSYRFRSTSGRRSYSFRARVPAQPGYPYRPGFSAARKVTVIGR